MAIKKEGSYRYDTEDIIGPCPKDDGDLVNDPTYWGILSLGPETLKDLYAGILKVGYCPRGIHFVLFKDDKVVLVV